MKRILSYGLLGKALSVLTLGTPLPAVAQHVICCNQLIDVGGNWIGADRNCNLGSAPPARRASLCPQLAGCAEAAPYCGVDRSCTVDGSIVDVQNQALGERLRISGTSFALHYRSDRTLRRPSNNAPDTLAGWSLDVHHGYDPAAKIVYTGDGRRRIVTMSAGSRGGEIRIPVEDGSVVDIFDVKGRHLRTINALTGAVQFRFVYDTAGRLVGIEDGFRNVTRIERDAKGAPTGIVAPGGQRTGVATGSDGYLASVTSPAGDATRMRYGKDGRLSEVTDPKGQVHRFTYSGQGTLLRDENPAGGYWALARTPSPNGFKVALSSALGRTATFEIELLATGEERRVNTGPGGAKVRVEKDAKGNDKVTDPDGTVSVSEFRPDPRWGALAPFLSNFALSTPGGRTLRVSAERKATLAQPNAGRGDPSDLRSLTESVTVNGRTYQRSFDGSKMAWTQTSPAGRQVVTQLNAQGQVVGRAAPGTLPVSVAYDSSGRLDMVRRGTGPQSRATTVSYDAGGRVARVVDPLQRTMRFEYDPAGRMIRQIFADGREIRYAYDPNGNLTTVTPPGQAIHRLEYSPADRVRGYLAPDASSGRTQTTYAYNQDKQLIRVTRPDAKSIELDYDVAGHVGTLTIPHGKIRYRHDAVTDALMTITATDGGDLSYEYDGFLPTRATWRGTIRGDVARTYDNDLRVTSVSINGAKPIEYRFDPDGLPVQAGALSLERHPRSGAITATRLGHVTTAHSYDDFGQIRRYVARFKEQEIFALELERDAAGRIVKKVETVDHHTRSFLYEYDPAGRLSEITIDGARTARYEYDANGNRAAHKGRQADVTATYDAQDRLLNYGGAMYRYTANGELASAGSGKDIAAFDYDALGNLRSASLPGGPKLEYVIDGANRRIGKKVDGKLVQGFLYADQLKAVAELDGGNEIVSTFVYATKANVPDYLQKSGATYRIITDHLGSPRLVLDVESGAVAQKMDYDEFGVVLQDTTPGFQPFGFAGGLLDSHTKLTRFMARDYDASTGRWTAKDPTGFAGGDFNLYRYALNDPVNRTDAEGLQVSDEFGIWMGPNWSDPGETTIVDIDSAGNVSIHGPDTHPVDFPLTGGPTRGPSYKDRVTDRFRKGWTVYGNVTVRGPTVNGDLYGQEDVAPGTCNDSWTGRNQAQNPTNIPSSPLTGGGVFSVTF